MTHHYRHWFNTVILRRVAVFTLSMFESVAPLTQGQETADEEEEVLESLVDSPKAQDDKKKELEALLQEPETDGTDSDSESDADAEGGETMTATLSDSELYLLGLALDEQNRSFEQKQDGTQATTDKLAAKAIADMQATPIPVGLTRSTDSPFSGQSTEAGGPTIVEDAISHDTDETAALLISSDDDDSDTNYGVQQSYSPLSGSLISTTGGTGSILSALTRSSLFSSGGSSSFSSSGSSAAGGGGGGASGGSSTKLFSNPLVMTLDTGDDDSSGSGSSSCCDAPEGDATWNGKVGDLKDGQHITFDKSSTKLDVSLTSDYRPWWITVDDTGVTQTQRGEAMGKFGYAFAASGGNIQDYEDESGNKHSTGITKKGSGILVLANEHNTFSGGVDVQGGILYMADQGALGSEAVTLHDGTSLWVNFTWNTDYSSSFRNPRVKNTIKLYNDPYDPDGTSATISYGDFVYQKVIGNNTSRTFRNVYLTGGLEGNAASSLVLQGYTSTINTKSVNRQYLGGTVDVRPQIWYSGYILNRSEQEGDGRFYGTLSLGNHLNESTYKETKSGGVNDTLGNRWSGGLKLTLSDDVLEYATLDLTRDYRWINDTTYTDRAKYNKLLLEGKVGNEEVTSHTASQAVKQAYDAAGGEKNTVALRQTATNTVIIRDETRVGELQADLLGVTQDTYVDAVKWTESIEVKTVKVITDADVAKLVLGLENASTKKAWYSGTMGLENQLYDADGDGKDERNWDKDVKNDSRGEVTGSSKKGISMVKVGDNTQYIHTADLRNLDLQGGTLGFNDVEVVNNLTLNSGTKLRLGVQDGVWTNAGSVKLTIGGEDTYTAHRLEIYTNKVDPVAKVSYSARVEGSLTLNASTELAFEVEEGKDIIPYSVTEGTSLKGITEKASEHSLLQVTAATGRAEGLDNGGVLTMANNTGISVSGINYLQEDYAGKVYFLAAADKIVVGSDGHAADFTTRIITLDYGYYGLVSTVDGHGYYGSDGTYVSYDETDDKYLGQDYLVMRVEADPTRSWTGSGISTHTDPATVWKSTGMTYEEYMDGIGKEPDAQWKENRAYTDGVSVKFGNMWVPVSWEEFLEQGKHLEDFSDSLTSGAVTKVGTLFYSNATGHTDGRTGNGMSVCIGGNNYGAEHSSYFMKNEEGQLVKFTNQVGKSAHYEKVDIDGTVRPGYITVGSDYNLLQSDGSYVTMQDDTNYVFTSTNGTGCIADATPAMMQEIYKDLIDEQTLQSWKTTLSKGGTGTLVIQTANTYSGGSLLYGGYTVMQNKWALGKADPMNDNSAGGDIEMAYGAGLYVDYDDVGSDDNPIHSSTLTNKLLITHMADFNNTGATGDAQLLNHADGLTRVSHLSSYDDAILTLRGASYTVPEIRFTYAAYMFDDPVDAYGTIRMAGYLHGADGRLVEEDGKTYTYGGGNMQLMVVGHTAAVQETDAKWRHTSIDLSLNGGANNVLALYNPGTGKNGASYVTLGTVFDEGKALGEDGKVHAAIVSDVVASQMTSKTYGTTYLTLSPHTDARFSGNLGFGEVQSVDGYAAPSRGYISLTKTGASAQSIGNARLYALTVQGSGLLHVQGALSVNNITTSAAGEEHIHVGDVGDSAASHTLIVKNGILAFDTSLTSDPLSGLKGTESDVKYGAELSYVLLQEGATLGAAGNWQTSKGIAVAEESAITVNTHYYSMDSSVNSGMDATYTVDEALKNAFDDSHVIWFKTALAGNNVTINIRNEQISAGIAGEKATAEEQGTQIGYVITHDLNAYDSTSKKVQYGLQGGSTVDIGTKTVLQSYADAITNSGIIYNIHGTDAALQFLDSNSEKLSCPGETSYVHKANMSEGGMVILGGKSAATDTVASQGNTASVNVTEGKFNITADADLYITNKEDKTATMNGFKLVTTNTDGYETILQSSGSNHAEMSDAKVTVQTTNNLLEHTKLTNTLVEIQQNMTLYMSDVTMDTTSKVQGAAGTDSVGTGKVVNDRPGAQSNAYTDTATWVSVTLTQDNTVTSNTQNKLQVMKVNQLKDVDMLGIGLTIGISQEKLESYRATCDILALEVTGTGIFTYEANGVLSGVQLADPTTGNIYATTDTSNPIAIADSAYVAYLMGVQKSQVSMNYIYIVLPEPTTGTLSLLALAALCARRRRTGAGKGKGKAPVLF